jgi:hypothetical protein
LLQLLIFASAVLGWYYQFLPRPLALVNGVGALLACSLFIASLGVRISERTPYQTLGIVWEGLAMILFSVYFLLRWQAELAADAKTTAA